jgi:DNA-binding response OmpR family regulator
MLGSLRKKRVLIVDDERVISDTLAIIFKNAGYDAKPVYSAERALEILNQGDWSPDLARVYRPKPIEAGFPRAKIRS